ncbi:MAG: diadenylate cyclase CdaA [Flavobacteriales bacterium]
MSELLAGIPLSAFLEIRWLDVLDIILVALLIYQLYDLVKGTVAIKILIGIVSIYLFWKLVQAFQMQMLSEILGQFIGVGVIALLIVFQQELRRFLLLIGDTDLFKGRRRFGFLRNLMGEERENKTDVQEIVNACKKMSETRTGALIVIAKKSDPSLFSYSGEKIDAKLSSRLLESIFFKNSPLHDGAVIVVNDRIRSARCILPVSKNVGFPSELGMRHRSALGIAESSDAVAIAVSEETGHIALAKDRYLMTELSLNDLRRILDRELRTPSL